jgi:choline-sulfatase
MKNQPPNIVVIMSDQHNPHIMGCSGDPDVRTPNIDHLAARGVSFTNMYCPYPLCGPARMGFMTGQYPSLVGVYDNDGILPSNMPTFAHGLGARGYETVLCGRMHFVGQDQFHGFEHRLNGDCQYGDVLTPEILGSGNKRTNGQTSYAVEVSGHGRTGFQQYDRIVTRKAVEFLRTRSVDDRPYCLVVGLMLPHNPLICDKELFEHYMSALACRKIVADPEPHPAIRNWLRRRGCNRLSVEQNHRALAAYYGLVEELDRNVGTILQAVEANEKQQETLVIYCSDHGDMVGEHGMWWKSNFYEGAARIPFILSWSGASLQPGRRSQLASLIDVGPTLLDIAGAAPLPDVEGRSFKRILLSGQKSYDWPNQVYGEYIGFHGDSPAYMVRKDEWKLIYHSEFGSCQLFNLESDPGELEDLAENEDYLHCRDMLLQLIPSRWNAQQMLENRDRANRRYEYLYGCGHPLVPHEVSHGIPEFEDHNEFDFDQLPWRVK